jgi:hypothetical protein
MTVVLIVAAAVAVLLIALVAVGREAFTLGSQPRQALFDVEEAVDFVGDRLPDEITARISYDDVRSLVRFHLDHLASLGTPADRAAAGRGRLVLVDDEESAEVLMTRAIEAGLDLSPDDIAGVLAAELAYFRAIGAVGPAVEEPEALLPPDDEGRGGELGMPRDT